MSSSLLLIGVGPVQEFIAQARRTRDLWFGSHLLSELSRAAARDLTSNGASMIFPALEAKELDACHAPLRPSGRSPDAVANKLLAEVPAGKDPAGLARSAREAVQQFWREEAKRVRAKCKGLIESGIDAAWDEQIDSFLEFTAAWCAQDGRPYKDTRKAVERALAARKNLRDFEPWRHPRGNVPKSSLDGERETVLRESKSRESEPVRRYRIQAGEQLDAVGLVKRAGGDPEQFVPIVNVALAPWVARAEMRAPNELAAFRNACEDRGAHRVTRDLPAARLGFDASLLLPSRWRSVFNESGWDSDPGQWGDKYVGPLLNSMEGEPYPYVVCLVADGDRLGRAIGSLRGPGDHRRLSRSLADFARQARDIVEQQHDGSLVYAGGDDVLAFLPMPTAVPCASRLQQAFTAIMKAEMDLPEGHRPTMSVGIGVGHLMEAMGDLLALGRDAERLAKEGYDRRGERNALAVVIDRRSGGRLRWRGAWDPDPAQRLDQDEDAFASGLSLGKVYEIERTLRILPDDAEDGSCWRDVLALEVRRSLSRNQAGERSFEPSAAGLDLDTPDTYERLRMEVKRWVDRMLIARAFRDCRPGLA